MTSGNRTAAECDDRCSTRHRLDHDQPEWLRPLDREQHSLGPAEKRFLGRAADLPDEFDARPRVCQEGGDHLLEITLVLGIDLGRDLRLFARSFARSRSPCRRLCRVKILPRNAQ